jgi:hypothetical protein
MPVSEFETKQWEKVVGAFLDRRRPPPHLRDQLDLGFRVHGQSVEIFETRPYWLDPTETIENPVAKATYVKSSRIWKVYWQRADLKWHRYDPNPEVATLQAFLDVVDKDQYACFFG